MTTLNIKRPLPWIVGSATLVMVIIITVWLVPPHFVKTPYLEKKKFFTMNGAYALSLSDKKELFVSDYRSNVKVFNLAGKVQRRFTVPGANIRGIRVKPGSKQIYVADWKTEQIRILSPQGGQFLAFNGITGMVPHGFLFLPNGQYLVSDNANRGVMRFNANNTFDKRFGKVGQKKKPGELNRTRQLAYDSINKHVYVTDRDNNRIQIFDLQGRYIRGLGDTNSNGGHLKHPHGIALDLKNKRVYVSDTFNNRIVVYSLSGRYKSEYKEFKEPRWMAVDQSTGKLYVASHSEDEVGVFEVVWKW